MLNFIKRPTVGALIGLFLATLVASLFNVSDPFIAGVLSFSMIYTDLSIKGQK